MTSYVDGVDPERALNAPSARSRDAEHRADPADRFVDQMRTFDNMRTIMAASRQFPSPAVNATRARLVEWGAASPLVERDALRGFDTNVPELHVAAPGYPAAIDLRRLTRRP